MVNFLQISIDRSWTNSSFFCVKNDFFLSKHCAKWCQSCKVHEMKFDPRATFQCVHFARSRVFPRYWLQRECLCVDKVQHKQRKMAAMASLPKHIISAFAFFRNSFNIVHNRWFFFFSRAGYFAKLKIVFSSDEICFFLYVAFREYFSMRNFQFSVDFFFCSYKWVQILFRMLVSQSNFSPTQIVRHGCKKQSRSLHKH